MSISPPPRHPSIPLLVEPFGPLFTDYPLPPTLVVPDLFTSKNPDSGQGGRTPSPTTVVTKEGGRVHPHLPTDLRGAPGREVRGTPTSPLVPTGTYGRRGVGRDTWGGLYDRPVTMGRTHTHVRHVHEPLSPQPLPDPAPDVRPD